MTKKLVITGTFSFPSGQAASARILNLACGFSNHIEDVKVISVFGDRSSQTKLENVKRFKGKDIPYKFYAHFDPNGTAWSIRIKNRLKQIAGVGFVLKCLMSEITGSEDEIIFVYGRSARFLKQLLKIRDDRKWNSKIVFDIVEPPQHFSSKLSFLKHPFNADSTKVFNPSLLNRFDLITFISSSLAEKYGDPNQLSHILPSVLYSPLISRGLESVRSPDQTPRIGYLGSLIQKDNPELMLKFMMHLEGLGVPFTLDIIGRFELFAEGREWQERYRQSSIGERVKFHFNPSNEERDNLLSKLDYLIMFRYPDNLQKNTFPTRIVELLEIGKPLIVYPFGDLAIYFKDCENSFIINEDNLPTKDTWDGWNSQELINAVVAGGEKLLEGPFNASSQAERILEKLN